MAVITALLLTVLLLSAAIVLDLAGLRADRVQSKSVADMAAAASVATYDPDLPDAAVAACQDAVDFARANLGDEVAVAQMNLSCADIYTNYVCNPGAAPDPPASYRIGDRLVEILIPVPTDHPLMEELNHGQGFDGTPCDRVGVRISRDRTFLLARIMPGVDGASTTQGSVGVTTIDGRELEYASLIVLQRNGCQTLQNAGKGVFRVFSLVRFEDEDGNPLAEDEGGKPQTYPGTITTDTLPVGCSGGKKIIETSNNATTYAEGDIYAHSLVTDDAGNASTYNPDHVASGALSPRPKAGPMITRALVDHQYNCQTGGYGDAGELWSPLRGNQPIDVCSPEDALGNPITPPPPYLEQLDAVVESVMSDFAEGKTPTGWSVFPDEAEGETCSDTATKTEPRYIVDCPESLNPRNLTFQDVEHIIFKEGLELGTNADVLTIEAEGSAGTTVTMYENGLEMGGGELLMRNVFTYIRTAATSGSSGRIDVSGSVNRFAVQGPLEDELDTKVCESYTGTGAPPAVCFAPVAFWSNFVGTGNGNSLNAVSGNAAGGIIGTVFTPNSLFRFRGSGDAEIESCGAPSWNLISSTAATLELVGAQFFTSAIDLAGDAQVGMCPNPDTTIGVPIRGSRLIR